jgi:tRNA pseudouridine38-40 synthase|tara:strand:+ start:348 stop:1088 length:741 start_codon:yes stop_codon:yes gene_type:complete
MFNYKIVIEYDGTDYVGWQRQDNGISIQEAIEISIFKLTGEEVNIFGAGRTDAGVHALGQVANFILKKEFRTDNIRDGLNQYLRPQPIAILKAELVNQNFHARFSAIKRTYEYIITNRRAPLTITKNKSWGVFKKLNFNKMTLEAKSFIGKNNLQAFRSAHCQSNSALKTIDNITIKNKYGDIIITVSAKSFLHSQVRIMVGTIVEIGKGKLLKSIKDIIKEEERSQAGITAPACGLYLVRVDYTD